MDGQDRVRVRQFTQVIFFRSYSEAMAVFGTAMGTLKRDKQKKSCRTPRVRCPFAKRLQRKTRIFELRGGKSEKLSSELRSRLSDALLVPASQTGAYVRRFVVTLFHATWRRLAHSSFSSMLSRRLRKRRDLTTPISPFKKAYKL